MYAESNEPRSIGESYAGAVSSSSMRVGMDSTVRTPGDLIAAAGMNRYRMGLALNRLMSEWNSGATPLPAEPAGTKEIRQQHPGMDASMVEAERRRRAAECARWNLQENMLRFQRLKTLGAVRAGLLHWVQEKGYEDAEHLVAAALRRFLSPVCPVCEGRKREVVAGTGRTGRHACSDCKGTGEAKVPYGGRGQRVLDYIGVCTGQAANDLREGSQKLRRGAGNVEDRAGVRGRDEAAQLQRADREAEADAKQDTAAVAATFRDSMTVRQKRESAKAREREKG